MRAVVCTEFGPPGKLALQQLASPHPGPGQVVIAMMAASVNFADLLMIEGKYQIRPEPPFVPGFEMAGVVQEVHPSVSTFRPGDRVIAISAWGAFAEEAAVDAEKLIPMPAGMEFTAASAFMVAYGTTYYALKDRGQLQSGETLLVLGASGGVGLAAIQIGKALGARVIAAASSDAKLSVCAEEGADECVNYATQDLRARVKEITGGKGLDVVYDPVGGKYTEAALRDMAWNGRFLVIGFATGDIPKVPINLPLLKNCSIVGVFWLAFTRQEPDKSRRYNEELAALVHAGRLRPRLHAVYPLERTAEALNEVLRKKVSGKLVVVP